MGTYQQQPPVSEQRSLQALSHQSVGASPDEALLLDRIRALEEDVARLRGVAL